MSKVLVTGANGYIAAHIVDQLISVRYSVSISFTQSQLTL
jgi:nucleoside-diphosphate-sugar epimerase